MVFEVGSFWQFLRILSLSPLMTLHLECWWVPILDKPIYNFLFQNPLFLPSKKIHNIWGLKDLTSLPGLIFFEYDLIEFSPNWLRGGLLQKTTVTSSMT
jgi:hypothetical protein